MTALATLDDEARLLDEACLGSAEAFARLVRLHQGPVRMYIGRQFRDQDVVDDLAQEVFLHAFRTLTSFRRESALRAWLIGIARVRVLLHLRAHARGWRARSALDQSRTAWMAEAIEGEPDDPLAREREIEALERCLEGLPAGSATLIRDYYVRRRTTVQMAQELGKGVSAVRMSLLRLRAALRRCMDGRLGLAEET
jgi:RNA polymerase sigma-70 factor (ECF subfamily)